MKSVFGDRAAGDIKKELEVWFKRCIGAYSYIDLTTRNPTRLQLNSNKNEQILSNL